MTGKRIAVFESREGCFHTGSYGLVSPIPQERNLMERPGRHFLTQSLAHG